MYVKRVTIGVGFQLELIKVQFDSILCLGVVEALHNLTFIEYVMASQKNSSFLIFLYLHNTIIVKLSD